MRPRIEAICVLAKPGAKEATLYACVDGKDRHETLNKRQVLLLLRYAAEAYARMEGETT